MSGWLFFVRKYPKKSGQIADNHQQPMAFGSKGFDMITAPADVVSDRRFRMLVEAIEDYAIYMLDPCGYITTWNTGAQSITGYTSSEIVGKHFRTFFQVADAAAGLPEEALAEAARAGHFSCEGWRVRKDGSLLWASVVINAMRDDDGSIVGFAKLTRDLTKRRANEERFRLLVEAVEDYAIYMLDPKGHVSTWNLGAQRNKGYSAEEIVGRHFSCFFTPADAAAGRPAHALHRAEADGHFAAEGWRVRKDGSLFWASVVINAIRDDRAQLIGFAKVTRDLTERRASEEILRASERALQREKDRLQIIIQAIGDGVISTDAEGRVTMMNPAAEVIAGCSFAAVVSRPIEEVLRLADADGVPVENPLRRCIADQAIVQLLESSTLLLPCSVKRDVHAFAAPIQADGCLTGAVLTLQDVTAMRAAHREIEFNALHDTLTRLPNRRALEHRIQSSIEKAKVEGAQSVLCILDLDRFKIVNDTAGHIAGDALLRTVSSLMLRHVRRRDMVARLGGDEFAVVLDDCSIADARPRLTLLLEKIAALEFFWEKHLFQVSGSFGAASIEAGHDLLGVVKQADSACYAAKHGGRNRLEFCAA